MSELYQPFGAFFPNSPDADRSSPFHARIYAKASKSLFFEALTLYLRAMRNNNLLTNGDKHLLLLATYGLIRLNNTPLARVLIRLSFSELTAAEMLEWLEEARRAQRDCDCEIPF